MTIHHDQPYYHHSPFSILHSPFSIVLITHMAWIFSGRRQEAEAKNKASIPIPFSIMTYSHPIVILKFGQIGSANESSGRILCGYSAIPVFMMPKFVAHCGTC